ncbi:MAG TPA: TonB-dependent receptor [Steroidobacteraceae bacterium]
MKFGKSRLFALAAAHGASLMTVPAVLQAADTAGQLEEIVVTARQREEKIEDVPVTITAFTQTEIKNAGIERPTDFIAMTAGVSQVQTAEAGDLQVNIRGINTGRDAETNFALVIDGVLQTNPQSLNQELSGVTQIEILKGPQGALYGRNAVAGAMIMTTRKPGDEFETDVVAGYGTNNTYKASIYSGGPISGNLKGSLSAYTRSTDGQWTNKTLDCNDCVDYFKETGVQGRLLFPVAGGDVDFKAKWSKIKSGAINFNAAVALADVAPFVGDAFYEDPNKHDFRYINNVRPQNEQENVNLSIKGDWDLGFATLTSYLAYNDQTNYFLTDGTSDAFNLYTFEFNPGQFSAVDTCRQSNDAHLDLPGYRPPFFGIPSSSWFADGNASGFLPAYGPSTCGGYQYQQRDQTDTSLEVRLTSPGDQRLRWVAGAYAADIKRHVVVSQGSDLGQGFTAQAFVPTGGKNPTDLLYDDDLSSNVYAVFGQLAYDVVDNLEVALAVRYDSEDRKVDNNVRTCSESNPTACRAQTPGFAFIYNFGNEGPVAPYINPAYAVNPSYATDGIPSRSKTFEQLQPKVSANWKLTDDFALFASYGYGFRSGGFNSSGSEATINTYYGLSGGTPLCLGENTNGTFPPACNASSVMNITDVHDTYKKEVSKAAELGFKSYFADRTVSLNAAVFYTKVEDMQFFNFFAGPFGLLRVVTNIDAVTIKGAELDGRWKIGEHFALFGGWALTDGNIDKYAGRPYTKGNEVPYAPAYTGNLGGEFTYPIGQGLTLLARLDASFVGETWFHPVQKDRVPNLFGYFGFGQGEFSKMSRDPYNTLNARLGVAGEKWGVTAWGHNITDEKYLAEIIPAPEFGGAFIHDAPGASYGVEVNFKF